MIEHILREHAKKNCKGKTNISKLKSTSLGRQYYVSYYLKKMHYINVNFRFL